MALVPFFGLAGPGQASALLSASIQDVQAFRDELIAGGGARKLNRRISSLSSF